MSTSSLIRVLVLAGVVTLVNAQSSVTGQANHLLAAETGKAPVNHAVKANADFAVDLYKRLAKENAGKNVFLSPYSVSTALTMVVEGARGPTADEIGRVLRFPDAARRIGDDAQTLPWNTLLIHSGMKGLGDRFNSKDVPAGVRERIAALKQELDKLNESHNRATNWDEKFKIQDKAHKVAAELNALRATVDQYELRVANGMWGAKAYPFRPEFVDAVNAHYGAGGVRNVDFAGDPEAARRIFNDWASDQTKGRIKEVLPAGSVTPDTRLILANAVYFLGEWAEPFDVSETKPADFLSAGGKVKTPMMRHDYMNKAYAAFNADGSFFATPEKVNPNAQRQTARYPGAGGFQMVELPYKGGDLSMVVLVPQSADGLAALEEKLASERLAGWMAALKSRTLNVEMPKFRVDTNYDLIPTLKSLGMTHAFDETADFGGIASEPLFIGGVVHKAFVEVGEKGTEAAAVTAIEARAKSDDRPEEMVPFIPTVRADRPFLFVIRDVKTGTVLFMGRVADPAAK